MTIKHQISHRLALTFKHLNIRQRIKNKRQGFKTLEEAINRLKDVSSRLVSLKCLEPAQSIRIKVVAANKKKTTLSRAAHKELRFLNKVHKISPFYYLLCTIAISQTALNGFGPRLDDTVSIPMLKEQADRDGSMSELIDNAAHSLVASLFYFKLDRHPDRHEGKFVGSGHILCSVPVIDPAFPKLMDRLSAESAQFLLDGCPICSIDDPSCWDKEGNFRKSIGISTTDSFAITLKRGKTETWNISASPFSVNTLIKQQRFKSFFGRPDHRKRKVSDEFDFPGTKRRRL